MRMRLTLLSLVAALLYVGPFLSGLGQGPALMVPIFTAVFVIWVAVMRPAVWARVTTAGAPAVLAARLAMVTLLQVLLVVVAFALGRGFAALTEAALALPLWLPPLLSLLAVPLARLVWRPEEDRALTEELLAPDPGPAAPEPSRQG